PISATLVLPKSWSSRNPGPPEILVLPKSWSSRNKGARSEDARPQRSVPIRDGTKCLRCRRVVSLIHGRLTRARRSAGEPGLATRRLAEPASTAWRPGREPAPGHLVGHPDLRGVERADHLRLGGGPARHGGAAHLAPGVERRDHLDGRPRRGGALLREHPAARDEPLR